MAEVAEGFKVLLSFLPLGLEGKVAFAQDIPNITPVLSVISDLIPATSAIDI